MNRFSLLTLVMLISILMGGCAKFPSVGPGADATRVQFTMRVAGTLRSGNEAGQAGIPYIYMVAIRTSTDTNPTDTGPIPVVAPPWGNGFVAGNATHFIWWDPTQATEYTIYKFQAPDLQQFFAVGVPITIEQEPDGSSRIRFEISLAQLVNTPSEADDLKSLQVNFLTMDRIPQTGNSKYWDALGDSTLPTEVNDYVTIPLNVSGVYDNARAGTLEPEGDQTNPDLDIVDWSIEVRKN